MDDAIPPSTPPPPPPSFTGPPPVIFPPNYQRPQRRGKGWMIFAIVLLCLLGTGALLAACGSSAVPGALGAGNGVAVRAGAPARSGTPPPVRGVTVSSGPTTTAAGAGGAGTVAVADAGGDHYLVKAAAVTVSAAVNVDTFLWSAAPGQYFLSDQVTVANPTAVPEPLAGFDDIATGLADDVAFVMDAPAASAVHDDADCGADAAFAPTLCPITYGQGLTVDSDSSDHDAHSPLVLAPGTSAQITYSYGPVLQALHPAAVTTYFTGGPAPVDLTP